MRQPYGVGHDHDMSFSLGVIVARNDSSADRLPMAAARRLVDGGAESLREYWRQMTYGHVDLIPTYYEVDVTLDATDGDRSVSVAKAYAAALLAAGDRVMDHEGFLIIIHPATFVVPNPKAGEPNEPATLPTAVNGGAASAPNGVTAAISGSDGSHSFLAHELGHVLGLRHSYGLLNNGIHSGEPVDGKLAASHEYGDPADIMSAESFGNRRVDVVNPTAVLSSPHFAGTPIEGWLGTGPSSSLGPGLSPALLHQVHPEWLPSGEVRTFDTTPFEATVEPSHGAHRGARLVVLTEAETVEGRGRIYLEWRPAVGWDAGLASVEDGQEDRAGLIVHELADTQNQGVRTWYRGVVPVPVGVDPDLDVFGTPYRVTVLGSGPGTVRFRVGRRDGRWARLDVLLDHDIVDGRDVVISQTPCGHQVRWGRWILRPRATIRAVLAGLGGTGQSSDAPTRLRWSVNGTSVFGFDGRVRVSALGGTVADYQLTAGPDGRDLLLIGQAGETYELPVRIVATDDAGDVEASSVIAFRGEQTGFHPDDRGAVETCFERIAYDKLRLHRRDLLMPPQDLGDRRRWQLDREVRLRRLTLEHPVETTFLRQVIRSADQLR